MPSPADKVFGLCLLCLVVISGAILVGPALSSSPPSAPDATVKFTQTETASGTHTMKITLRETRQADGIRVTTTTGDRDVVQRHGATVTMTNLTHGDEVYVYAIQADTARLVTARSVWDPTDA